MYHGFTGHEMLDDLGLIHMNGRLYDPMLGRFVCADFMIPDAGDLQSYNRYTYVFNNPLAYTDASGQCPFCLYAIVTTLTLRAANVIDTQTARTIIGLAVGAWMGPGAFKAILGPMGSAVAVGGITGGISSGWDGARAGMLSAGLFYVAGSVADVGKWGNGSFGRTMTHAVAGCIGASASGGNCSQGAMAAGFAQFAGPIISDNWNMAAKTFGHAMLGGVGSVLGGGKFENGAVTGAFGYLFNDMAHVAEVQKEADSACSGGMASIACSQAIANVDQAVKDTVNEEALEGVYPEAYLFAGVGARAAGLGVKVYRYEKVEGWGVGITQGGKSRYLRLDFHNGVEKYYGTTDKVFHLHIGKTGNQMSKHR